MTQKELWALLTSLAGVFSVAILGWKNYRLQAKNNLFDDLHDMVETYREEVTRLKDDKAQIQTERDALRQEVVRLRREHGDTQRKLHLARKQAIAAQHEAAVCQERLEIERRLFEQRLEKVLKQVKAIRPEPEILTEKEDLS